MCLVVPCMASQLLHRKILKINEIWLHILPGAKRTQCLKETLPAIVPLQLGCFSVPLLESPHSGLL